MPHTPRIAIINPNALAALGLKSILQEAMPMPVAADCFGAFVELEAAGAEDYYHYFVSLDIALAHRDFFLRHRAKTIVLTPTADISEALQGFHQLCYNTTERLFVRELLALERHGHTANADAAAHSPLSTREQEVMALIVQGKINKEIAAQLCISLPTVITHRRNIMQKLGLKSVSALTIYAVTHGYVDINTI